VDEDTLDATILPDLDPDDPGEGMEELVVALYDEDEFGIESPLGYEYESVTQQFDEGAVGFTPEGVQAQEAAEGPIPLPREMFVPAVETDEAGMEGIQYFEQKQTLQTLTAEPMAAVYFTEPTALRGTLKQVKMTVGAGGPERLALVLDFDQRTYQTIENSELFGLTDESRGKSAIEEFDADLPIEMTVLLTTTLMREHFGSPGVDLADTISSMIETLANPYTEDPLKTIDSYVYQSVMQKPEGTSFYLGFNNKNLPE
jgi:hypothetical protein